ncbi:MAG: DUF4080 domain-containing protein [Bacilli bacterium]|nr:DUF4080 domain-containing protein [Bacilli bacterium]
MHILNKNILLIGINSKYIHPAMGVFQLYTNTDKEKYNLDYFEFTIKDNIEDIINQINNHPSSVISLSCYIWNIEIIKQIIPNINNKIIILGGPEASFNPNLLYLENVNYLIKGEGEESFTELLEYLNNQRNITDVSNLNYLDNNTLKYTYTKLPNLENVKHDLSLIKDFKNRICYVESSRGCFYNCSYCLAATEKPVRFFPIDEVKANILYLLQNNAKVIKFLDRSFNIKKDYINEILSFIKENDNNISTFQFEVNGDNLHQDTIDIINSMRPKMIRLEIGIQTTNPDTSKAILRHQNFNKLKENILKIKDNTIIHTDLIAGLPLEDYESFKNSFNETFLLFTEELQLGTLKELKGTHISKTKQEHDYIFSDTAPFEVIQNKYITKDELDLIRTVEKAVDKFYNYGYFKNTINYLFNELKLNPFDTFLNLMKMIEQIKPLNQLQFDELTRAFYYFLSLDVSDKEKLLFIIKEDYLTKNKIKPKIWWHPTVTREIRREIYLIFKEKYNLNIDELYKYAHLEKYNNEYLLINYKTFTKYKIRL